MARRQSTPLRQTLSSWFPSARIRKLSVEEAVVQRQRRVDPVALVWVVVLSVSPSGCRTLAELDRSG